MRRPEPAPPASWSASGRLWLDLYKGIKDFGIDLVTGLRQYPDLFCNDRPLMAREISLQRAVLHRARDLSGGVSNLSKHIQISSNDLDDMLHDRAPIPNWVFLRAVDYVNEHETSASGPLGAPPGVKPPKQGENGEHD